MAVNYAGAGQLPAQAARCTKDFTTRGSVSTREDAWVTAVIARNRAAAGVVQDTAQGIVNGHVAQQGGRPAGRAAPQLDETC